MVQTNSTQSAKICPTVHFFLGGAGPDQLNPKCKDPNLHFRGGGWWSRPTFLKYLSTGTQGILSKIFAKSNFVSLQWRIQDFPQGGAPTPKSAIIFQFYPRKLHENERIWTPGGGARPWRPPLDPPVVFALRVWILKSSLSITGDGEFTQITSEGSTYVVAISTNSKLYYRTGKIV